MPCTPTPDDHCCWLEGVACPFFDAETPTTDKRCTLRTELGSWEKVHADPRYVETVKPVWIRNGIDDCGDWFPTPEQPCGTCGWGGDR